MKLKRTLEFYPGDIDSIKQLLEQVEEEINTYREDMEEGEEEELLEDVENIITEAISEIEDLLE